MDDHWPLGYRTPATCAMYVYQHTCTLHVDIQTSTYSCIYAHSAVCGQQISADLYRFRPLISHTSRVKSVETEVVGVGAVGAEGSIHC